MRRWAACLVIVLAVGACAQPGTPATKVDIENGRIINAEFDTTWIAIIETLAALSFPITTLEKNSRIVAITDFSWGSGEANEGERGPMEEVVRRRGRANVLARKIEQEQTPVTMKTALEMQIQNGNGSPYFPKAITGNQPT